MSPLAPPVYLSASSNTLARLTFLLLLVEVTHIAQSKSDTGTDSCTFDRKVMFVQ